MANNKQYHASTPFPNFSYRRSVQTQAEFRRATIAMQRAADAMVAATSSYSGGIHTTKAPKGFREGTRDHSPIRAAGPPFTQPVHGLRQRRSQGPLIQLTQQITGDIRTATSPSSVGPPPPRGRNGQRPKKKEQRNRAIAGSRPLRPRKQGNLTTTTPTTATTTTTTPPPLSLTVGRYTYLRQDAHPFDLAAASATAGEEEARPAPKILGRKGHPGGPPFSLPHEILFVLVIALAQALMLAGVAQALIPARLIGQTFFSSAAGSATAARPADLSWFSAAYALTSGTFRGRERGMVYFVFCRAMQGIGPALLVPNGQALLGRAYSPGPRRNLVMSLFGAAAPLGFVAGGAMASLCAQTTEGGWPWAFWILAALCLVLALVSALEKEEDEDEDEEKKEGEKEPLWKRVDLPGMVLGVSGLVLFNFAWNQAAAASWATPYVYFLLVISVLLLGAFAHVERHAAHPLVPWHALDAQAGFVLACTAAGWGAFGVWVFYSFRFLEELRGWTPLLASASHAHRPVAGLAASLLTARLVGRRGVRPHWIMLASMLAFAAGSLLMATAPVAQTYWTNTFLSVLVMPFGMDMSNPTATILISNSVGKEHQGIAASLVVTVVNYSISTALGFATTIEVHLNRDGADVLAGFRGAQYFGVGLSGLGIVIALAFLLTTFLRKNEVVVQSGAVKV
ncbi:major facilitator superfamily-domain-containing protein [Xylariomycetidae sp. FL2044]|nr:major facilitator superfamily-domain-containing protein [Xylariomycetidae sp. FL2044]